MNQFNNAAIIVWITVKTSNGITKLPTSNPSFHAICLSIYLLITESDSTAALNVGSSVKVDATFN